MNIEVTFWVKGKDGSFLGEEDIEWHLPELKEAEDMPGFIRITGKTSHCELTDDLDYIIPRLCFLSIPGLSTGKTYHIIKASSSGSLDMRIDQDRVLISGTNIRPAAFQREDLLNALYRCGLRFLEFLKSLNVDTDTYDGTINELETARTAAQKFI